MGPEAYGLGGVALAVIAILSIFVRSLVKRQDKVLEATIGRQDQMFTWFTGKLNGSLDALKLAIEANRQATEHNTRNLKTIQELSGTAMEIIATETAKTAQATGGRRKAASGGEGEG